MYTDLSPFYYLTDFKNTTTTDIRNNKKIKIPNKNLKPKVVKDEKFDENSLVSKNSRNKDNQFYSFGDGEYNFNKEIKVLPPVEKTFYDERFNIKPSNMLTTRPGFGIQQNWLQGPQSIDSRNLRHN